MSSTTTNDPSNTTERYIHLTNIYLILPTGNLSLLTSLHIDATTGLLCTPPSSVSVNLENVRVIDLKGKWVSPGMIDIQINGAFGVDLSEFTTPEKYVEGFKKMSEGLCNGGVTSFLPTIISQKKQVYHAILPILTKLSTSRQDTNEGRARSLGWHLEGPFLHPCKSGCHPSQNLVDCSDGISSMKQIYGVNNLCNTEGMIKMITLAPDVEGVLGIIPFLAENGWKISLGHTNATFEQAFEGLKNGATMLTHMFNAMPSLHHRDSGVIGLLGLPHTDFAESKKFHKTTNTDSNLVLNAKRLRLQAQDSYPSEMPNENEDGTPSLIGDYDESDKSSCFECIRTPSLDVNSTSASKEIGAPEQLPATGDLPDTVQRPFFSIIADGIHVHPQVVAMAYNSHPEGCILISDAMHMMDPSLPDGLHPWRGSKIEKKDRKITLEGTDTLAGSILPLQEAVINLSKFAGIPLAKAVVCATYVPAQALGGAVEKKVGLQVGCWADLCIWDGEGLKGVWKGRLVWYDQ
ncbi:uncharacterized protein I303_101288 [Kwoniella dejecticola CBS 10117]|uniref:N-acetylglucosamine-6-phosphate deacetylase n=1 Tax=Kwoniella dejecticola CBS 10117 TaxID=1296121 RepID=A0A1A6AHD0_9TREE|nr:uncharacterized protein I303_01296 [Kwoniella dejecticola CBS 10117]OBR89469.1 hypothetical protein I303_01296 [Kwoniella dejecticola CBS 10117]